MLAAGSKGGAVDLCRFECQHPSLASRGRKARRASLCCGPSSVLLPLPRSPAPLATRPAKERERESERRRVTEDREKSLREKKNEGERERRQHCRFAPWNLLPPWTPSPSLPLSTEGFGASGALMLGKACALHRLRRRAGARARRRYRALPGGT